ncbi:dockerin type I domain-containing protein [Stieleria sp. JC731]|uniref:dockerin type I domain-containing protein n=1 Tax=Pirellulaceae TaxID=2691357 RepID=UPI001E525CCD|nr:dockerin type I domain-containing protein [Stieleria sp. JC731]MCC9599648.1 dockerin type I domain-containing protein [Stieleria sp. JC731]
MKKSRQTTRHHSRRQLLFQLCEQRQLMAADMPYGATPTDTGEFLLGTVTVTPVFFESDGSIDPDTENWDEQEIDATLAKIQDSVDWWSDLLATKTSVHSLDFVIDDTYARTPVSTGYEPISRSSQTFQRYVGDWLTDLGYGDAPSIERAVHLFNDSQRQTYQTDWAFTIFVVDASEDDDGFFAQGGFIGAFAYAGGLFMVIPNGRPTSTFSHEMGHIFWARDQYPGAGSWTDQRGYYNAQNYNASDNPTPGFIQQPSIMRGGSASVDAFNQLITEPSALAMIGWQDTDGDGIFDVADVPLILNAVAYYDTTTSSYRVQGEASVDTLANQNSEGMQSDITLARVRELQYQIDNGGWQSLLQTDDTNVSFDLEIAADSESYIEFRAIDTATGITSEVLTANRMAAAFTGQGGVYAFLDSNLNGVRDESEPLFIDANLELKLADGSDLHYDSLAAAALDTGILDPNSDLDLTAIGDNVDGRVAVFASTSDPAAGQVFQAYDSSKNKWKDSFGDDRQLQATSENSTGIVTIDFTATDLGTYGLQSGSYARVEAFDSDGNRLDRVTSALVLAGESGQVVVEDSLGRISKVVVYGHAETQILINGIHFGSESGRTSSADGLFSLDKIAAGSYQIQTGSPNLTYQFAGDEISIEIDESTGSIALPVVRVDSPRFNTAMPGDVNGDGLVSVRDALVVINDLGRLGFRTLTSDELTGFDVDVNNDGIVSPSDALRVINMLAILEAEGESVVSSTTSLSSDSSSKTSSENGVDSQAADFLFSLQPQFDREDSKTDDQREFFGPVF